MPDAGRARVSAGVTRSGERRSEAAGLDRFPAWWVDSGEVTAVYAAVADSQRLLWSGAASAPPDPEPGPRSLFDAASLTKPWMATLALRLDASGTLGLGTRLGEVWPDCGGALARRTLDDLLRHRAGIAPWTPLYHRCGSRAEAESLLASGALVVEPQPRGDAAYSDLDYILWGFAVERRLGTDLAALLRRDLLEPLRIEGAQPAPGDRPGVVACHCDTDVEVELAAKQGLRIALLGPPPRGAPQDGNARFLGALAGHAGLFVDAEAMLALGQGWLRALEVGGGAGVVGADCARRALAGPGAYALGWARRRVGGTAGPALSAAAVGHVGFTGTSLWIDPDRRALFLLLAHRRRAAGSLNGARRRFHALGAAYVEASARGAARTEIREC